MNTEKTKALTIMELLQCNSVSFFYLPSCFMLWSAVCNETRRTISYLFIHFFLHLLYISSITTSAARFFFFGRRCTHLYLFRKTKTFFCMTRWRRRLTIIDDTTTTTKFFSNTTMPFFFPIFWKISLISFCACISMFLVYLNKVVFSFFRLIIHSFSPIQCHSTVDIYAQAWEEREVNTVYLIITTKERERERKCKTHWAVTDEMQEATSV